MGTSALTGAILGLTAGGAIFRLIFRGWEQDSPQVRRRKRRGALVVVALFLWIGMTFQTLLAWADLQLNASFTQRLTVLAPKLSAQEHKEFLASWASMTSRRDYVTLNTLLEQTATSRGVKLPKVLLK